MWWNREKGRNHAWRHNSKPPCITCHSCPYSRHHRTLNALQKNANLKVNFHSEVPNCFPHSVHTKFFLFFFRSKNPKCTIQIPEDELLKLDGLTRRTDGQTPKGYIANTYFGTVNIDARKIFLWCEIFSGAKKNPRSGGREGEAEGYTGEAILATLPYAREMSQE